MGKTKRELLKRQMAHSWRNLTLAMNHLGQVEEAFSGTHEEYAKYLQVMVVTLDAVRDGLKDFCTKAWGSYPEKWSTWRNEPGDKSGPEYEQGN